MIDEKLGPIGLKLRLVQAWMRSKAERGEPLMPYELNLTAEGLDKMIEEVDALESRPFLTGES
jgi:hypothetical protein